MAIIEPDERYFVYENRLASFHGPQPVAKIRTSTASSRAPKTLNWPHKGLSPVDLAKAGFYFYPLPNNPDNVVCFLCSKSLDGWEEDDNPLDEHLRHSPGCGWAITAAIEVEMGDYHTLHPLDPRMVEARKATFAGRWPYDSKKGFKCETKQLVEAGWKFTPTLDSDDNATCSYCQLALDGWEAGDKPIDEHYKRSPECPFFTLLADAPAPPKKSARSKASRLSTQSIATATSEVASQADMTAAHDDSVMTTASTLTQGGGKKTRARKAPAASKARKTRAKKDEAVEIHEDEPQDVDEVPPPPPPPPPPATKPKRGRKRASDAVEDSVLTNAEAPAPKKRATRARGSAATAVDASVLSAQDVDMVDVAPAKQPARRKKGRASGANTTVTRKTSQSSLRSQASTASLRAHVPDDDELDRQLQADLERPLTDDEDLAADSESERKKKTKIKAKEVAPAAGPEPEPEPVPAPAPARGRPRKGTTTRKASAQKQPAPAPATDDYAMFDPAPAQIDDAAVEAEFKALEAEAAADDAKSQASVQDQEPLQVPKKGRKAGTRKASKQTKKAKEPSPPPADDEAMEEPVPEVEQAQDVATEEDELHAGLEPGAQDPDATTGTVVTTSTKRTSAGKKGRGRPPKKSKEAEQPAPAPSAIPAHVEVEVETSSSRESFSSAKRTPGKVARAPPASGPSAPANVPTPTRLDKALPPPPPSSVARAPGTPRVHATPSAKQATISPSQSPQSSDAENQPPSSKPASTTATIPTAPAATAATPGPALQKRVVLAPVLTAATPARGASPTRKNVIAGLVSTAPWTATDVDLLFSPSNLNNGKDNGNGSGVAQLLRQGAELTTPEKAMTVEEWIFHNAGLAEQKLRMECEAMVSTFESEGGRAMRTLEGLVVD